MGSRLGFKSQTPSASSLRRTSFHESANAEDGAKDILYIHDTLEVFGARLPELQQLWRRTAAPHPGLPNRGPATRKKYRRRQKVYLVNSAAAFAEEA
jgi:hypothetical protein